jgi:hypothetical protein
MAMFRLIAVHLAALLFVRSAARFLRGNVPTHANPVRE